jgi:hypothetical protein
MYKVYKIFLSVFSALFYCGDYSVKNNYFILPTCPLLILEDFCEKISYKYKIKSWAREIIELVITVRALNLIAKL